VIRLCGESRDEAWLALLDARRQESLYVLTLMEYVLEGRGRDRLQEVIERSRNVN
jgi:hypothetical protein